MAILVEVTTRGVTTLTGEPVWMDLPVPRALHPAERELLATLAGYASCDALTEQVASARVTATCRCGCSSVRLGTDGPRVPAGTTSELSRTGRDDYFGVGAIAGDEPAVDVVVHVLAGTLTELELYAGDGVPVRPPAPEQLHDFELI